MNSWLVSALLLSFLLERASPLAISTPRRTKKRKASPPRKTDQAWRYSQPKSSKWDVRHTKSFRFEIRSPASSDAKEWDVMPLHKKPRESLSHVLGKGLIWSLFKDRYGSQPNQQILVETPIPEEDRFVPDVVAFECDTTIRKPEEELFPIELKGKHPTFWGESGRMSAEKAAALACKYPNTHFVHFRWGSMVTMDIFEEIENAVLPTLQRRTAPFQFALIPEKPSQFLAEDGTVLLKKEDIQWRTAGFDIDLNY